MKESKILVPTDFSTVGECALQHAVTLGQLFGSEVLLMHVVPKQKDVKDAESKLNAVVKSTAEQSKIKISGMVKVGNIFEDIGGAADEAGAKLIIMGTHGVKGIQNITGSYALKVITNSTVPFIVVQKKILSRGYNLIVLPFNLSKHTKQKLAFAVEIARSFNSKILLITPKGEDSHSAELLKRNMVFAAKQLRQNDIEFTAHIADEGTGSFAGDLIKFAADNKADLISIVNFEGGEGINLFGSGFEQKLISNAYQIPVMCVNPISTTRAGSVLSS